MDPLTRMADQLRAEKERLTNELANIRGESEVQNSALDNMARKLTELECERDDYKRAAVYANDWAAQTETEMKQAKAALIAQYDAIMAAVNSFRETAECCDVLCDACKWENGRLDEILDAITKHDPRKGAE